MASLVWAVPSAPLGRARRMARARAWQWPRSSCRSSWWKTSRVGWRHAVSPDWTTFFTSCRGRAVTRFLPVPDAQTIPLSFPSRGVAHKQERPGAGLGGGAYRGVARWDWLRGGGLAEGGTCEPAWGCSSGQRGVGARVPGSRGPRAACPPPWHGGGDLASPAHTRQVQMRSAGKGFQIIR